MTAKRNILDTPNEVWVESYIFHSGCFLGPEQLVLLAHYQPALDRGIGISEVFLLEDGIRWSSLARFKWQASGLLLLENNPHSLLVLGRDGEVASIKGADVVEEARLPGTAVGPMCGLAAVGDQVMAYGMKRELFRRLGRSQWEPWNQGMNTPLPSGIDIASAIRHRRMNSSGLEALVPGLDGALYAFGSRGEIWQRTGDLPWKTLDSPTHLGFAAAIEGGDGLVYACGQAGTLVRGGCTQWATIEYDGPKGLDFCSLAWFNGKLHVADGHSLRALESGRLELVDLGGGSIVPSSCLCATEDGLLSVAGKEIFLTHNGKDWRDLLA